MRILTLAAPFLRHPSHILKNVTWRRPRSVSQLRHVFVVGAPRSGTTLVRSVLAVHDNLGAIDVETGFFMLRDLFSYHYRGLKREDLDACRRASRDIVQFYDAYTQAILARTDAGRFVEKTPQHVLRIAFLRRHFPAAQFINLCRDGRDCLCSARSNQSVIQSTSAPRFARYWRRCVRARQAQGRAPNVLDVKYEELARDPEQTVRAMMDFLGEEFDPRQIDPAHYSQTHLSGVKAFERLQGPISDGTVGRWRQELSPADVRSFSRVAGAELRLLGYET